MTHYVGLDVSQKLTTICIVDDTGRRLWRGQCTSDPEQIFQTVRRHAGEDARIGIETGPMTPWLAHELRSRRLDVTCLDARHARAALKMQINKTDQNDAEGLAQIMRRSGYSRRSLVETAMYRYKTIIGRRLYARILSGRQVEAKIGCNALNRMTSFGMPATIRTG
jgi:transposase